MARQYNIPFHYRGATYSALVTVISSYPEDTFSIYVPDESLHDVLPGGKMIFSAQKEVQRVPEGINVAPDLFRSIVAAVEAHENRKATVGLW